MHNHHRNCHVSLPCICYQSWCLIPHLMFCFLRFFPLLQPQVVIIDLLYLPPCFWQRLQAKCFWGLCCVFIDFLFSFKFYEKIYPTKNDEWEFCLLIRCRIDMKSIQKCNKVIIHLSKALLCGHVIWLCYWCTILVLKRNKGSEKMPVHIWKVYSITLVYLLDIAVTMEILIKIACIFEGHVVQYDTWLQNEFLWRSFM